MSASIDTHGMEVRPESVPRWVGAYAEQVVAARDHESRLKRVLARSPVPIILVDQERRYVEANTPARLAFRLSIEQMRGLRIDDLTPPHLMGVLADAWERLLSTGVVAGPYEIASPSGIGEQPGTGLEVVYYALANVLPGQHLIAFAPADWSEAELVGESEPLGPEDTVALTPRELQVLELAAEGNNGPMIAEQLVLSAATVRTHFENIYAKLGVRDRAAAVAKAMRLGLIT
jgi:DNA-binding NarL/FixJ family response regulator